MLQRTSTIVLLSFLTGSILAGCSMQEEMRRIDEVKRARANAEMSRSTNLTGEQIFIRSCNTCHLSGEKGPQAPTLINMDKDFPNDEALKAFLRKGKGTMPPFPASAVNDTELDHLVDYLRQLNVTLHEDEEARKQREIRQQKLKEQRALEKEQQKSMPRKRRSH
jgi:mono/diheme cytochrome c family protein